MRPWLSPAAPVPLFQSLVLYVDGAFVGACGEAASAATVDLSVSAESLRASFSPEVEVLDAADGTPVQYSILATEQHVAQSRSTAVNEAVTQARVALDETAASIQAQQVCRPWLALAAGGSAVRRRQGTTRSSC